MAILFIQPIQVDPRILHEREEPKKRILGILSGKFHKPGIKKISSPLQTEPAACWTVPALAPCLIPKSGSQELSQGMNWSVTRS